MEQQKLNTAVFELLSSYCFDKHVKTGEYPTREQMQTALEAFMCDFYIDDETEE